MGAGYGGSGESLTYQESADFKLSGHGTVLLGFLNPISIGNGFDSSTFEILVNGGLFLSQSFNDLASANDFFTNDIFDLGQFSGGVTDVELLYQRDDEQHSRVWLHVCVRGNRLCKRGAGAVNLGDDADRLRWSRLYGLSQDEGERGGVVNRGARDRRAAQKGGSKR